MFIGKFKHFFISLFKLIWIGNLIVFEAMEITSKRNHLQMMPYYTV